jgi:hypothetical protein
MPKLSRQVELALCAVDTAFKSRSTSRRCSSATYRLISANLIAVDGSGELPSVSRRALRYSLLKSRRFQSHRLVQFFGEPIQWVDTAWCLAMTLVSSSAIKCLVGWGSKAIRRGLLTFDVKEKLAFEMSQLLIRQQGVNVFSYATVRISDITVLFASCDAFLYPFLLFIFGSFFFLLHFSVWCAIIILNVFSSYLFLSFLLSFIFFILSSKQLTHRNLTKLPRIFQMWFSS